MIQEPRYKAFSLIETLLAVGTLAIGMIFIAGAFLTGIHLTAVATEQTIAAVAADEAFAKIKLYGINSSEPNLVADQLKSFIDVASIPIAPEEFDYPSTSMDSSEKQYCWSALCRRTDPNSVSRLVQVTVFVARKAAGASIYRGGKGRPIPMPVNVTATAGNKLLTIAEADKITWINDGCKIVDNQTGQIYRVLQRYADRPDTVQLDQPWQGAAGGSVWVIPPPINGGKDPCIGVYQKIMRF